MDTMRDFKPFQGQMDKLWAIIRGAKEAPNSYVNAMWDALKDVPYSEVETNVTRIVATATRDTPLPRPRELRNSAPKVVANDPRREAADRESERNWRELRASDPIRFQVEWGIARAARELSQLDMGDPGYEDWSRVYQRWASVRYAPREEQERMIARLGAAT